MRVGNQFSPIYDGPHFTIQAAHMVFHVACLPLAHGSFDEQTSSGWIVARKAANVGWVVSGW